MADKKPRTYLLRNPPEELWRKARDRAYLERIPLRELILRALTKYLDAR
jgi:hypothetical protein